MTVDGLELDSVEGALLADDSPEELSPDDAPLEDDSPEDICREDDSPEVTWTLFADADSAGSWPEASCT